MTSTLRYLTPLVLLLVAVSACGEIPESFVAQFYPASLTTTAAGPVPLARRQTVFTVGSLTKGGSPLVVAVFTNGVNAAVSVISPINEGAVLATAAPDSMGGRSADVTLIDFDGSGNREIVVTMEQYRGLPGAWIFRWTGSELENISPVNGSSPRSDSDLSDPTFLDLEGNGHISIIEHEAGRSTADDGTETVFERYRIFRFISGHFEQSGPDLDYFGMFSRGKGTPAAQMATFDIADVGRGREVLIVNGGRVADSHDNGEGSTRVSSAEITLNGQPIATPDDFNGKTAVTRVTTQLKNHNELSVKINGGPGSGLSVLILPKATP